MSQNVQIGISKFHGIWTLALTDTVTLKDMKIWKILFFANKVVIYIQSVQFTRY